MSESPKIQLQKVSVHNLKKVSLELKPGQLIVFTGVSGSGKSSLAFDTIYAEGQRRYIESLSTYARRYMGDIPKPDAELITGISPTISIEQKTTHKSPRSTVGTITGIYDYLRVLFARIGVAHCPESGERVTPQSNTQILEQISELKAGTKLIVLAPFAKGKKGEFKEDFAELLRKGFMRVRVDGEIVELEEGMSLKKSVSHDVDLVVDRLKVDRENRGRLKEAVSSALELGKGVMSCLEVESGKEHLFSTHAHSAKSGISYPPLEPQDFSFNHPKGMCPACSGLGTTLVFDEEKIIDEEKSISEDCIAIAGSFETVLWGNIYRNLGRIFDFNVKKPWKKLSKSAKHIFLHGTEERWTKMTFVHPKSKKRWIEYVEWKGVLHEVKKRFNEAKSEKYKQRMLEMMSEQVCPDCLGARIRSYPRVTTLGKKTIHDITSMTIAEAANFFDALKLSKMEKKVGAEMIKELQRRLHFLLDVGLHYISLERTSATLSGGEAQRVRLASQIGAGLIGTTYILDEPSIGLHPTDNERLIRTLLNLRDQGNTVIVVEHDEETIYAADEIVDVGPGAGVEGGEIVAQGKPADLIKSPRSVTGAYLSGKEKVATPKSRRKPTEKRLVIRGAEANNLQKMDAEIPLGLFVAVTGISGAGKSSLIIDTLYPALSNKLQRSLLRPAKHKALEGIEHLDKVIAIDQTPIGRTPRSNPATYVKLFDDIRNLFASLPDAKAQGFSSGRFSFNVREGSCPKCSGMGQIRIDMDFLEDSFATCPLCDGRRFDPKTLSVLYKGKSIYDVMRLSVREGLEFFDAIPNIRKKLQLLNDVGLGYMKIGQSSTTLSGGEAQRIKLAKELIRPSTGQTLYILDEPTTGLHFRDIDRLLRILERLVSEGNTVLVIEHNLDLIKVADWVIDLEDGNVLAEGTPEQIIKAKTATGIALGEKKRVSAPSKKRVSKHTEIVVKGAEQNNLKGIDLTIPRGKMTVCTGPSGSGKSSLAFETIYAEGQRRYIESLPSYARQFVKQMAKPKLELIEGLSPAISIEQKRHAGNPRSTIGTMTEVYDYLRLLYAHLGEAFCPETGEKIVAITKEFVCKKLQELPEKTRVQILAPLTLRHGEDFSSLLMRLKAEGFRRVRLNGTTYDLEDEIPFSRGVKQEFHLVIDRIVIKPDITPRLFEAVSLASERGEGKLIAALDDQDLFFNLEFAVPSTGRSYPQIKPHTFSFNSEEGMCPDCQGLGIQWGADLTRFPKIMRCPPITLFYYLCKDRLSDEALELFEAFLEKEEIDPNTPLCDLSDKQQKLLMRGSEKSFTFAEISFKWIGFETLFAKRAKAAKNNLRKEILPHMDESPCPSCNGARLNPLARGVKVAGKTLPEVCELPISQTVQFLKKLSLPKEKKNLLDETLSQIDHRLKFMMEIGLEYLALSRSAPTLSGGETQRIHLARQLGSGLTGCLYVLDEPTIGLHPQNNALLNRALKKLCKSGNTLLLVEHDPLTINTADYLIDFGPEAGKKGGQIIAQGSIAQIKRDPKSLTGAYLSGEKSAVDCKYRKPTKKVLKIENASLHNLKNISLDIPLHIFTCITGVSGSGKSTLMHHLLRPAVEKALTHRQPPDTITIHGSKISGLKQIEKCIALDQSPIGHTARADITTYSDLLTPLRRFFAELPEARMRNLKAYHFSYNHMKGMCRKCWGLGTRKIQLQLMPAVTITCDSCNGNRLAPLPLEVTYKGKNLGQLLNLTVNEAIDFLPKIPKIQKTLKVLVEVGLGYLTLGQRVQTLSGGEAQRLRLSRELVRPAKRHTLYLFDEPTIGLHSVDIEKLLKIFHKIVDSGHTIIMIEHNSDIIESADYQIELGPGAGEKGGKVVNIISPTKAQ
ncbi:MAG: excinuclease ABC subunit UvrA [Candidatus Algichlamydia australiensis]|nr:excinuclease ABC subunit UvrA [Chlamydiales bacterium]